MINDDEPDPQRGISKTVYDFIPTFSKQTKLSYNNHIVKEDVKIPLKYELQCFDTGNSGCIERRCEDCNWNEKITFTFTKEQARSLFLYVVGILENDEKHYKPLREALKIMGDRRIEFSKPIGQLSKEFQEEFLISIATEQYLKISNKQSLKVYRMSER